METKAELELVLHEIARWEQQQKDLWFWEKLGRLPFVLLDKLTPAFVQEKLGAAIDELCGYIDTGGRYLVDQQSILKRFDDWSADDSRTGSGTLTLGQVSRLPLAAMNQVAADVAQSRVQFATIQGATTGFGGLFTLSLDIPLLIGTSLKVLQETAIAFGYDPNDKRERLFVIKCLQFVSSDIVGKQAILASLATFAQPDAKRENLAAELQGWREVMVTYTENFGWKKLFQLVPVAGMVFGSYLNRKTVEETAEAGRMLYKKRRTLERMQTIEEAR